MNSENSDKLDKLERRMKELQDRLAKVEAEMSLLKAKRIQMEQFLRALGIEPKT